ncbi:hypothetical protein JOB18_012623 [Solea senegalensis]|uniref:Uncharacterized protein n=1 Tax=Solea senegalensis TaxID=28829 RepID=A0AAV6RYA9_SOLSE|nr:hypothetical protein JOB18_012623 [Solea senegalensis]
MDLYRVNLLLYQQQSPVHPALLANLPLFNFFVLSLYHKARTLTILHILLTHSMTFICVLHHSSATLLQREYAL